MLEDVLALLLGTLIVSFGVGLLKQAGVITGDMAGLAFLIHYATGVKFGIAFFFLNLPFYQLVFRRMGLAFLLKTFSAITLVSVFSELHPKFIDIAYLNPFYAALFANAAMGLGFLVIFLHKASLGDITFLALYLQDRYNIRAGKLMMTMDAAIVLASLLLASLPLFAASICGVLILNSIIAMNHRPNRYLC